MSFRTSSGQHYRINSLRSWVGWEEKVDARPKLASSVAGAEKFRMLIRRAPCRKFIAAVVEMSSSLSYPA